MRLISLVKRLVYILLLLLGFTYFFVDTSLGSKWTIKIITSLMPGSLQIQSIKGKLASGMTFENIRFVNKNMRVSVKSFHFIWRPSQLIHKKISLREIDLHDARIDINKNEKKTGTTKFDLAHFMGMIHTIHIDQLRIKNFLVTQGNVPLYKVDELTLSKKKDESYALNFVSSNGNLQGQFSLTDLPNLAWRVKVIGSNFNPNLFQKKIDGRINFLLQSTGIWHEQEQKINLEVTNINGQLGEFPLQGLVSLDFNNGALIINKAEISLASAQAKLSGRYDHHWNMHWQVNIPQMQTVIPRSRGAFSGVGKITGDKRNPEILANIAGNQIAMENISVEKFTGNFSSTIKSLSNSLELSVFDLKMSDYRIPNIHLDITSNLIKDKLISHVVLSLSANNQMKGEFILPQFKAFTDVSQPIEGEIKINLANLNDLISSPELSGLKGNIKGDVKLSGKMNSPRLIANASLEQGHAFIPKLRIDLDEINLQANYQPNMPINVIGKFKSGKGEGQINGQINIKETDYAAIFRLDGTNLQLANLNEYKVIVSPNLTFSYDHTKTK